MLGTIPNMTVLAGKEPEGYPLGHSNEAKPTTKGECLDGP